MRTLALNADKLQEQIGLDVVGSRLHSDAWDRITELEKEMEKHPDRVRELPIRHLFTPGLYVREIFMPAGTLLTSRIHLLEHPFVISMGKVSVWDDENGVVTLEAPHTGITAPGTRRVFYIHTDTILSTFHVNPDNQTNPDKIGEKILFNYEAHKAAKGFQ